MHVTMLLDCSGSMQAVRQATIDGFNSYIDGLRHSDATVTLITFKSPFGRDEIVVHHRQVPAKDVSRLTWESYVPDGGTPLNDATVFAIRDAEGQDGAIIVIQTDGQENASKLYKIGYVRDLVKAKQGHGWQFIFIGAGIDAYREAAALGIGRGNTMSYEPRNTAAAFASVTNSVNRGIAGQSMSFTPAEKKLSGDFSDDVLNK